MIKRFRPMIQDALSFWHYVRTHERRIRSACLLPLISFVFTFGFFCSRAFDNQDIKIYWWALRAKTVQLFWGPQATLYGDSAASWVRRTEIVFQWTNKKLALFTWYGLAAGFTILVLLVLLIVFLFIRNQRNIKAKEQKFMAGSFLRSRQDVIAMIKKRSIASPLALMDLPLIKGSETKHIMITGTYGSGKTNAVKHILNQIQDQKALIVDTKGELIHKYYNQARGDIVMNPLDLRYPGWHTLGENQYDPHYEELEQSLGSRVTKFPISIKQWIQDDTKTGWLFLSMTREEQSDLKPLFAYWLSLAMKSLCEDSQKKQRPLWVVIDTLSDLPKIKDLALCLSEGKEYGVCMVLCTQHIDQLETIYGQQVAQILVELCATQVLFRCANSDLAQKLSHQINTQTQACYGNQQKIPARELTCFPDFVSCVQLPYGYPATKIKWELMP